MKQSTAKRFSIGLIPTTLILVVITLAFIMLVSKNAAPVGVNKITTMEESHPAPIKNKAELDEVTKDLDTANLDSFDGELQTISKDAASF